jgi:hypothetical protein
VQAPGGEDGRGYGRDDRARRGEQGKSKQDKQQHGKLEGAGGSKNPLSNITEETRQQGWCMFAF